MLWMRACSIVSESNAVTVAGASWRLSARLSAVTTISSSTSCADAVGAPTLPIAALSATANFAGERQ